MKKVDFHDYTEKHRVIIGFFEKRFEDTFLTIPQKFWMTCK